MNKKKLNRNKGIIGYILKIKGETHIVKNLVPKYKKKVWRYICKCKQCNKIIITRYSKNFCDLCCSSKYRSENNFKVYESIRLKGIIKDRCRFMRGGGSCENKNAYDICRLGYTSKICPFNRETRSTCPYFGRVYKEIKR